ncbi:MAG: hypothetical protein EA425_03445 [Puniceicoccaceae bacterium]|nr:MAG: hypothetical protein EA425_03445 [Puniceicoccaceae bacterium]
MSGDREKIFQAVREALAPLKERAPRPDYDPGLVSTVKAGEDLRKRFAERWRAVNGVLVDSPAALKAWLLEHGHRRGYCDPVLMEAVGKRLGPEIDVLDTFERARPDDYAFGITRASHAVAETGTVVLEDRTTSARLAALAPWVHVSVFPAGALLPDLQAAAARLGDDPNVIWVTGPSKTADVEGILIEGVHGPGVEVVLLLDDAAFPS